MINRLQLFLALLCFVITVSVADLIFLQEQEHRKLFRYLQQCSNGTVPEAEKTLTSLDAILLDGPIPDHTVLMLASLFGCHHIVFELLQKGCNPNQQNSKGSNAFIAAMRNEDRPNRKKIMQILISAGFLLDKQHYMGATELGLATQLQCHECMEVLINNKANLHGIRESQLLPLLVAIYNNCQVCWELLIDHGILDNCPEDYALRYLHAAIEFENGTHEQIRMIMEAAPSVHNKKINGKTVLFMLLKENHIVSLEYLLDYLQSNHPESLKQQLTDLPDNHIFCGSLLSYAAAEEHGEAIELLIRFGAGINDKSDTGRTALTLLSSGNCLNCVKLLLENGADVNLPDSMGLTPVERAYKYGNYAILQILAEAGGNFDSITGFNFYLWVYYQDIISVNLFNTENIITNVFPPYIRVLPGVFTFFVTSGGLGGIAATSYYWIYSRCKERGDDQATNSDQPESMGNTRHTGEPFKYHQFDQRPESESRLRTVVSGDSVTVQKAANKNTSGSQSQSTDEQVNKELLAAVRHYILAKNYPYFIEKLKELVHNHPNQVHRLELSDQLKNQLKETIRASGLKQSEILGEFTFLQ